MSADIRPRFCKISTNWGGELQVDFLTVKMIVGVFLPYLLY